LHSYSSNSDLQWISLIKCVRGMKLGKAPGIDGIEAEHFRVGHGLDPSMDWVGLGQDFEEALWIGLGPMTATFCFFHL